MSSSRYGTEDELRRSSSESSGGAAAMRHEEQSIRAMSERRSPTVVYIAGAARSGSTILDQILGELPGFISTGELLMIWQRGLVERRPCGCSVPLPSCEFWRSVFDEGFGGMDKIDARRVLAGLAAYTPAKQLIRTPRGSAGSSSPGARYGEILKRLYCSIAEISQARVIVDSSKTLAHAFIASAYTDLDILILHLVRDPRAVVFSWERNADPGNRRPRVGVAFSKAQLFSSAVDWFTRNLALELFHRRERRMMRVRYEDFARAPEETVQAICRLIGESPAPTGIFASRTVYVHENHMVGGNRTRYLRGPVEIRPDDQWQSSMPLDTRVLSSLPAFPLLRRYGYPVLPRRV
jgi:sulfotransferase family protein